MSGFRMAALPFVFFAVSAFAQESYPSKPIRIVVGYSAGGGNDLIVRVMAPRMSEGLGQPIIIENKPGAQAIIASEYVAKASPDGYTLLMMSNTHTVNESLIAKKPFELMRDFAPVAPVNYSDLVLVVHPSVPANSLKELIALSKAKPGGLNYASSGPGTPYHMAGELFKAMAGVDIVHVPYKGSSGARTDILGGQVQMMFDAITTMAPNVRAGKLRAFGTTGKARSPVLPEIPTVSEAGVPGYEAVIWLGLMAPAATPKPILEKLNAEIRKVVNSADVKDAWAKQGAAPMSMSTDEFGQYIREDIAKWAKIVKMSGAKVD